MRRLILIAGLCMLLAGCAWQGTGTVVDKGYRPGYMSYCGKGCWYWVKACHSLALRDEKGDHSVCVRQEQWDRLQLGDKFTVTR